MPRAQFLLGFVVLCTTAPWILADLIDDGNSTVDTTTTPSHIDKTRREELEQYYEEQSANNVENAKDANGNSPLNPAVSLRMSHQPVYPVEELTDFQTEVPCDNAQFLLRILTVMLPLLRSEVPENKRTSYILLILKDLLKSSPEAAKDYDIHNKINDLILALEKYHRDDTRLDDSLSSALRKRPNVLGLPDGIKSKVIFQYEVPRLPNPSCTAEILYIVKVVQKAILKLVNNPLCQSIVPLEVPFFVNFEENHIKPDLYLPSKAEYKILPYSSEYKIQKPEIPSWVDDNTDDIQDILIPNKLKNNHIYPYLQNLINEDMTSNDDLILKDIYPFFPKHPKNPTERPFKPHSYDNNNWPYPIPVNVKQLNDKTEYPGYSDYFDQYQLTTPSSLDYELGERPRPHKKQPDTKYPELDFPFKTDDERNPALLPFDFNKYVDNIEYITNTNKPRLIETTGEPQTAYIPFGLQNSDEDEIYYIRPGQRKIKPNKYDKLPATRPLIIGQPESVNTPRYPNNPYAPNWPFDIESYTHKPIISYMTPETELADIFGPTTESTAQFDIFGRPIKPIYTLSTENPIDFDIFGRPKWPTYQTTENSAEFDIFGQPRKLKYPTTTENSIKFDIFGRPTNPKYPYNKKTSHRPRPKGPMRPKTPLNWPTDDTYDGDYTVTPDYLDSVYKSFDIHPKIPYIINPMENPNNYINEDVDLDYPEQNKPDSWDQKSDSNNDTPYPDRKILQIIKDNIDVVVHKVPVQKLSPELIEKIIKLKELLDLEQITVEEYVKIINQYQIIIEKVKHMDISNAIMKDLLLSITNLDKLDLVTGKSKVVEFTYLIKRPQPLVYQPYYYIKYRLPYTSFLLRIEKLLADNPQLTNYPAKLYKALIPISQVHETSPDLDAYGDDDILRLTFNDGTLAGAKFVKGKDIDIYNAIDQLKQINSDLSVDDTYQLIKNLESKLKYTSEGMFVKNSNIPALNVPENPHEIRIKVNNKPVLKKITKITTNKIGANKIISDILNKFKYLRSNNGSDEDSGNVTIMTTTDTLLEDKTPLTSDIPKAARSRDDYSSYLNEHSDTYKPVDVPKDNYLQSVNFADFSSEGYTPEPVSPDKLKWDPYPFSSDYTKPTLQDVEYIKLPSYEQSSYAYIPKDNYVSNSNSVGSEFDDTEHLFRKPLYSSATILDHFKSNSSNKPLRQLYNSDTHFSDSPLGLVHKNDFIILPEPHLTTTYISKQNEESDNTQNVLRSPIFSSETIVDHFNNNDSEKKSLRQIYEPEQSFINSPLSENAYLSNPEPSNSHLISHSKTYISKPNEQSYFGINSNIADTEFDETQKIKPFFSSQTIVNHFNNDNSEKNTRNRMHDTEYVSSPEPSNPHLISHSKTYINGFPVAHTKTYHNIQGDTDGGSDFQSPTLSKNNMEDVYTNNIKVKENNIYKYLKEPPLGHVVKSELINPNTANLQLVKHSQSYVNGYPVENTKTYVTNGRNDLDSLIKSNSDAEQYNAGNGLQSFYDKASILENYKPAHNYDNGITSMIDKKSLLENYKPIDEHKNGIETKDSLLQNFNSIDNYKNVPANLGSQTAMYNANANAVPQNPGYVNNQFVAGNYNQDLGNIESNMEQNQAYNGRAYSSGGPYISGNNYNAGNNLPGLMGGYSSVSSSIGNNFGTSYRYIVNQKPVFGPIVRKITRRPVFG